ncbi:MAG: DUF3352 domain-containing protein [Coleofasciculus sp. G1-WW12-02]|uniref:DUF3352 domain-containing protein n=1 Tax=Coleofasciculus sp. G1-WW12-02 TaxID=3068483 RepID=UPI00330274CB
MSFKKFLIIGTTLVAVGGGAAYLYAQGFWGVVDTPAASAKVIPDEAVMVGFISTDPQAWMQLQKFGTPELQTLVNQSLDDLQAETFKDSQISYEKDLEPWLGNVTVAVLPSTSPEAVDDSQILTVVTIKNKFNLLKFASQLKREEKLGKTQEIDYNGLTILETTDAEKTFYSAVLRQHLVISEDVKPVQLAIDSFKGKPSLASQGDVAKLFSQDIDILNPIVKFYIPDYTAFVQEMVANNPEVAPLPPATLEQLQGFKSVKMGMGIDDVGIRLKTIANVEPSAIQVEFKPNPGQIISQFPASTMMLLTGNGISQGWDAIAESAQTDPQLQQGLNSLRSAANRINLDVDNDIFGWMDGEFALGVIPSTEGILAPVGFGGVIVFQTSDRATAQATLTQLDTLAQQNTIQVLPRTVQGQSVTEWTIPGQGTWLGYGWLDQNTLFIAIGEPMVEKMLAKTEPSLDQSESFTAVTENLPQSNNGYFYLDMDKTMTVVNGFLENTIPETPDSSSDTQTALAILNSVQGIGGTATHENPSTHIFEMIVRLEPKTINR